MRMNGRNGVDDVVTRLPTGQFEVESGRCGGFSLLQNIQTDSEAHAASSVDSGGSILGAKLTGE